MFPKTMAIHRLARQPFLGVRDWWIAYLRVVPVEF